MISPIASMSKITILGVRASGKTTLANKLGGLFGIPVTHLDRIFWSKKGGLADDVFVKEVEAIISNNDAWIIEGSLPLSKTLDLRIAAADTIIFYHLPLYFVLWRQTKRFFKWFNRVRPDIGGDNKQRYPFTWKEIQHARHYPNQELYAKIAACQKNKTVIIIKNRGDEKRLLRDIHAYFSAAIQNYQQQ